jgi:hypothetical protein
MTIFEKIFLSLGKKSYLKTAYDWFDKNFRGNNGKEHVLENPDDVELLRRALDDWKGRCFLEKALKKGKIRPVYPSELFPSLHQVSVPVAAIHQESGHPNHTDMVYVCAIARAVGARRIFEIGTYRGQTTCAIAQVCPEAEIFTLNLPPEADARYAPFLGWYIRHSPFQNRIRQLFCDSRLFDTGPYRKSMDFVFVDGDHSYDAVKNDTAKALELLRPGGVVIWHDFAGKCPGVIRFLEEFSEKRPLFHIRKTCLAVLMDGIDATQKELAPMDPSLEEKEFSTGAKIR